MSTKVPVLFYITATVILFSFLPCDAFVVEYSQYAGGSPCNADLPLIERNFTSARCAAYKYWSLRYTCVVSKGGCCFDLALASSSPHTQDDLPQHPAMDVPPHLLIDEGPVVTNVCYMRESLGFHKFHLLPPAGTVLMSYQCDERCVSCNVTDAVVAEARLDAHHPHPTNNNNIINNTARLFASEPYDCDVTVQAEYFTDGDCGSIMERSFFPTNRCYGNAEVSKRFQCH